MILVPTQSLDDWKKLLADPEKHWKAGYSAHALASTWDQRGGFPTEISDLMDQTPVTRGATMLLAIPELKIPLAGGARASQTDLWV